MCVCLCVCVCVSVCACRLSGVVYVAGRESGFGVASQEPWIQNASVRDNILFGRDYDSASYQAVVEACALKDDLSVRIAAHFFFFYDLPLKCHHV